MRLQRDLLPGEAGGFPGTGKRGDEIASEPGEAGTALLSRLLVAVFAALIVLTLALIFFSFPAGVYAFYFTKLSGNFTASYPVGGFYAYVGPQLVLIPVDSTLGQIFIAPLAVYLGMLVLAATEGRNIVKAFSSSLKEGFSAFFSNKLLVVVIAIGFLVFTVSEIDTFETSAGIPVGNITADTLVLFYTLASAPLREEIGFRLVMIGALALVACVGRSWKDVPAALWRPATLYENRPRESSVYLLLGAGLAVSSVTFGLVHILSGSGWEIGKLPEATYAGVVLGYLYIRYGFHVAVLAHWGVDYLGTVYAFFGQGVAGIPYTSDTGYILQQVVSIDLYELIGLASFLVVAYLGLRRFLGSRARTDGL